MPRAPNTFQYPFNILCLTLELCRDKVCRFRASTRTDRTIGNEHKSDGVVELWPALAREGMARACRRRQEAELRHHRARQPRRQRLKPPPGLPATSAWLMPDVADIFRRRQDGFDDGGEELGEFRRP